MDKQKKHLMKSLLAELERDELMETLAEKMKKRHGLEQLEQMQKELSERYPDVMPVITSVMDTQLDEIRLAMGGLARIVNPAPASVRAWILGCARMSFLSSLDGIEELIQNEQVEEKEEKPDGEVEH